MTDDKQVTCLACGAELTIAAGRSITRCRCGLPYVRPAGRVPKQPQKASADCEYCGDTGHRYHIEARGGVPYLFVTRCFAACLPDEVPPSAALKVDEPELFTRWMRDYKLWQRSAAERYEKVHTEPQFEGEWRRYCLEHQWMSHAAWIASIKFHELNRKRFEEK